MRIIRDGTGNRLNVYAGDLEVRPPGALTIDRCARTAPIVGRSIPDTWVTGFEFDDFPHAAISHLDDPTEHVRARDEKQLRAGGFGLLMARAQVDELVYNEKQNEVIFIKYLD